jgi:hypothetical protein
MMLLRRVASQSVLCYVSVTVLSWFAARPVRVAENGPHSPAKARGPIRIDPADH